MKNFIYIILGLVTFFNHSVLAQRSDLESYVQKWQYISYIERQLQQNHTLFPNAKCDPCQYLVVLYKQYIQLVVENPKDNKVEAFQFDIAHDSYNVLDFDEQRIKLLTKQNTILEQKISRFSRNGLEWKYQFTLPIEGVIIKGEQVKYQYIIPIVTLIFAFFIFAYLPLRRQTSREIFTQIPRRTPLISLVILSQAQHIILFQLLTVAVKYIIWEQAFLFKVLWYVVCMIPSGFTILHILYIYDSIKTVYYNNTAAFSSNKLRDPGLLLLFFFGIYCTVIGLLYLNKSIWIFYYFSFFYIWQFVVTLWKKKYPYLNLSLYFFILVLYLMFLANFLPLYWFQQHTRVEIVIYFSYLVLFYLLGSLIQKLVIKTEYVQQLQFEVSKQLELGQSASAKGTQQDLENEIKV